MNAKFFTALTKQFFRTLENLSEQDLIALENRSKRLEITLKAVRAKESRSVGIENILDRIKRSKDKKTVEEAIRDLTKEELVQLCRALDLPVQKSDKIERLQQRLVQSTVGFITRSQAIQGGRVLPGDP